MKNSANTYNDDHEPYLAKWLAGELSDSETIEIIGKEEFLIYSKILKGVEIEQKLNKPIDASYNKILQKISEKKNRRIFNFRTLGLAASIVGVAFILIQTFFNIDFTSNNIASHYAEFGTQKEIKLLDNSEVVLNSNSKLTYKQSDWDKNREIVLEGEAYFKVSKGKTFTVNTSNGTVQVLGTQFNVISNLDYFTVVCYEGKVMVKIAGEEHILTKNSALSNSNGVVNKTAITQLKPSWLSGESSFESAQLNYVLRAIENQFNVDINYDQLDSSHLFTGFFPHNNLEVALQTVLSSFKINYKKTKSGTINLSY
jgi:ferric-dicitrate binding protein FerR (iron transport regulator)